MAFKFYALLLCGLCVIVFLLQLVVPGFTQTFLLDQRFADEVWRSLTAIFLHGSVLHLSYNLFALALFGSILEHFIGGKRFLVVFFVTGILANVVALPFYLQSLGASGAIFGVIGALIVVRPGTMVFAFGLPMPIFVAGILWTVGDIIGIFVPSSVGSIAHLAGIFFGLLFGFIYRPRNLLMKRNLIHLDERSMRDWEDRYLRRL